MRASLVLPLAAALVAVSCSAPAGIPATSPPTATASVSPSPVAAPTAVAAATPTVAPTSDPATTTSGWVEAGTMAIGRRYPDVVALGNGNILVVGNGDPNCVRADSVVTETWDPATSTWTAGPSLATPRAEFAAVALGDGRALLTGGVNAGTSDPAHPDLQQAYASTYLFDPRDAATGWVPTGLLGTARVAPAASTLADGRVLVAGGVYLGGDTALAEPPGGATLAAFRPPTGRSSAAPLGDVTPPTIVPALATAQLYDPASGSWSNTGALHFARIGAPAVTLADGRVLVVGSRQGSWWGSAQPEADPHAFLSAEIYDPRTGQFSLAGALPPVDLSAIPGVGKVHAPGGLPLWTIDPIGSLVALADGGALYVDKPTEWVSTGEYEGQVFRTLRFDPADGTWTEIDRRAFQHRTVGTPPDPMVETVAGRTRAGALVARLADGRVLVAGGTDGLTVQPSTAADLYDPVTGRWTSLPPMPEARADGAAVALADGSVLLVGGRGASEPTCGEGVDCECGQGPTGIATAIRFVPGP